MNMESEENRFGKKMNPEERGDSTGNRAAESRIDHETQNRIVRKISAVGISGNILLSLFKLIAGIAGHSGAMLSDAVHSLSDVFATLIALIGVKLAKKKADVRHPYGHDRFECVASLALGIILAATGIAIGMKAVQQIVLGSYGRLSAPGVIALVAAVVSIVSKEGMYWYTRHYAKILHSEAFMADAWHHRSDAFSSIGSLIGITAARMGFPIMDPVARVIICIFILKVACDIGKGALNNMMDESCGKEYDANLRRFIEDQQGVDRVDLLHTRRFGSMIYIDLEIAVDGSLNLTDAHEISQRVHDEVERHFAHVKHIMIHVNPA